MHGVVVEAEAGFDLQQVVEQPLRSMELKANRMIRAKFRVRIMN